MYTLGINSVYHESAAALFKDGELICFVEEERLNRFKHAKPARIDNPHQLPEASIKACLNFAKITIDQIDHFAYSFSKAGRLQNIGADRFLTPGQWGTEAGEKLFHSCLQMVPDEFNRIAGKDVSGKLIWCDHHLAHAASAFYCSPFKEALVLVVDGIGEFDSITAYQGRDNHLQKIFSLPYPHSLGFLWEKICVFLGFGEHDACKLMGLSSYGDPDKMSSEFMKLAWLDDATLFKVDNDIARFRSPDLSELEKVFGPARKPDSRIEERHWHIAAALQAFTESALLSLCQKLSATSPNQNLCLAGGTALNCVANTRIAADAGFKALFIQPAANDAGTAPGAALHVIHGIKGLPRQTNMLHSYWGPDFSEKEIIAAISAAGLKSEKVAEPEVVAARKLNEGKIVGWFQGRMETGPRALGNRSLLADPRRADMREILNRKIKHREDFRPFAPSILSEKAEEWFEIPQKSVSSDFMLFTYKAKPGRGKLIPAVMHIDDTSRIQTVNRATNPRYHRLIREFSRLSGVPLVLNTSFNDSEPIVMSPADAIKTFTRTGIDVLVLGNYIIFKDQ